MSTQRLYELDTASTRFPEQLDEFLRNRGWIDQFKTLPMGELVELTGRLDHVRPTAISTASH